MLCSHLFDNGVGYSSFARTRAASQAYNEWSFLIDHK